MKKLVSYAITMYQFVTARNGLLPKGSIVEVRYDNSTYYVYHIDESWHLLALTNIEIKSEMYIKMIPTSNLLKSIL